MPEIVVDGNRYTVRDGANLLKALLSLGLDLPYFCWHPALGSVGACRQCAVVQYRDAADTTGRLVMACMTPVSEGLRIGLQAPDAREFRASVIELLMTNHPHDCPVCEEGGECHLQDMTVMTGHVSRRYRGPKRTHRNQYLGPFINHEMNRCIACYRCVRFYRDYAGGEDLDVFSSRNQVYFGRFDDGVLESEFSGNLVEVCPTGVFTDKTFSAHYARKWDLQMAPSVCVHCGVGCNTSPGERYGTLRRVVNRYHGEVNGYFLCDRGRFGYGFVNAPSRIHHPLLRGQPIGKSAADRHFGDLLQGRLLGIGSPRATLEANFALRELVGRENFHAGIDDTEYELLTTIVKILTQWPVHSVSLREAEQADAILVLGEDIANTAPRLSLSLRQAVRNAGFETADRMDVPRWHDAVVRELAQDRRSPLFVATPCATRLDGLAERVFRGDASSLARLAGAIAAMLDVAAGPVADLSAAEAEVAGTIVAVLKKARRPLLTSGTGCRSLALIQAVANIAKALAGVRGCATDVAFIVPECNSLGLALMDARPLGTALATDDVNTVIVLENDLYRRADDRAVDRFLAQVGHSVLIDHTRHRTADAAELVLPGGSFAESEGTLVSYEGRAQRYYSVMTAPADARDSWRWLAERGPHRDWSNIDQVSRTLAGAYTVFARIQGGVPSADFRIDGLRIARQPHRYSGRTAMHAAESMHEPKPVDDSDSPLSFSMEGDSFDAPAALRPFVWAPGWNSNQQAVNKFQQEVGGALLGGDPGVLLLGPSDPAGGIWYPAAAWASPDGEDDWLSAVPVHHTFGSDELSVLSPSLAERVPSAYIALNSRDAERTGSHATVDVVWGDEQYSLPLKVDESLPMGVAGVPVGLPGMPPGPCPERLRIGRVRGAVTEGDG